MLTQIVNLQGPYQVQSDLSLKLNPYSWNTFANLLYVVSLVDFLCRYTYSARGIESNLALKKRINLLAVASPMSPIRTAMLTTRLASPLRCTISCR